MVMNHDYYDWLHEVTRLELDIEAKRVVRGKRETCTIAQAVFFLMV